MPNTPFAPVILYSEDAQAVHDALLTSGHSELADLISQKAQRTETDRAYASALELWDDGEFEVDENPIVSSSKDGAFVMVWQWLGSDEIEPKTPPPF